MYTIYYIYTTYLYGGVSTEGVLLASVILEVRREIKGDQSRGLGLNLFLGLGLVLGSAQHSLGAVLL